jgi:hypothetical protein
VSAVTAIGSPLTLFSAVNAEAVAAVSPAATVGTITPPGKTLVAPTTALVAAPVIRLLFSVLHPAILSEKRARQRYRAQRLKVAPPISKVLNVLRLSAFLMRPFIVSIVVNLISSDCISSEDVPKQTS